MINLYYTALGEGMDPFLKIETRKRKKEKMADLASSYWPILVFMVLSFGVAIAAVCLSFIRAPSTKADPEKISPYECGFAPFEDARIPFDVRFYLVSLLFIIFDLEVAFLFSWALCLSKIGPLGFWSMMIFLLVLTVGFIYEWRKGALQWE